MTELSPIRSFPHKLSRMLAAVEAMPPVECPVENLFAPGVYIRKCTIPAGVTGVGAAHKTAHFCIMLKGRLLVATANGEREFVAGDIFLSQPGDQRVGHAIEETVWLTIHPNVGDSQDLAAIIPRLVHATVEQLQGGSANPQALRHNHQQGEQACLSCMPPALPS